MAKRAQPPPSVVGPEPGPAKPARPGPEEPPGIAASILPQRRRDAARHPADKAVAPESVALRDDIVVAGQAAVETGPDDDGDEGGDDS